VYQEDVPQGVVKPLNTTVFSGQKWVFQQDSAPAHKAKTTQEWLRRNVPAFISAEDWPSGSPDLNPLDYKLWAVLEDMACRKRHNNLDSLKRSLVKAAAGIPLETVRAAILEWPEHLKACVGAEGGHFE
jgi:inhibitor of nuclear factor kappa-B kinase subunit alpha